MNDQQIDELVARALGRRIDAPQMTLADIQARTIAELQGALQAQREHIASRERTIAMYEAALERITADSRSDPSTEPTA